MRLMFPLFILTFFNIHTSKLLQDVGNKDKMAIKFMGLCLELNKQFEVCDEYVVLSDSDYENLSLKLRQLDVFNKAIQEFMFSPDRRKHFSDSIEKLLIQGSINGDNRRKELFFTILQNNEHNIEKIKKSHLVFQKSFYKLVQECKNSAIDFSKYDKEVFEVAKFNKPVSQEPESDDEHLLMKCFGLNTVKKPSPEPSNREKKSEVVKIDPLVTKNPEVSDAEKENISKSTNSGKKITLPNKKRR